MPIANIEINAVDTSGSDVPINVVVQLSNADVGGEVSYAWTIVDQPEGAADALSNPAIENPTFTPKKEGSYLVRLVVNAGIVGQESTDYAVVSVLDFRTGQRVPAAGETLQRSTARGWAEAVNRSLRRLDVMRGDPGLVACTATAGMAVGSIVRVLSAVDTLKATLPGEEVVPRAVLLGAGGLSGTIGQIEAVCDGGAIAAGKLVLVRVYGLTAFSVAGAPLVGDPVWADAAGAVTLVTPTTRARWLGRVVSVGGGFWRWFIEGNDARWDPRLAPAALGYDAGANWARQGGTSDMLTWRTAVAGSSRLIVPLAVYPGEVLWRVEAEINLANAAGLIDAYLSRGTATAGAGAIGNVVTSAAAIGAQTLNIAPGAGAFTLPYTVPAGMSVWVGFEGNGGGGNNRDVGSVTAYVRPA